MNSSVVAVKFGLQNNPDLSAAGFSIDNHPSGAIFYQHEWSGKNLGAVKFSAGKHDFLIGNVLSALGSADKNVPGGVYKWSFDFGVSPSATDTEADALKGVMAVLKGLQDKGWARYINPSLPRLKGRQAWSYQKNKWVYPLDASYTPTLDEWKEVLHTVPRWRFYADGVFLDVMLQAGNLDAKGDGAYLLTVTVRNEYAFFGLGYFSDDLEKLKNWKKFLPDEIEKYHAQRLKTEAALKGEGYVIDTSYEDPPIHSLQGSASDSH